MEQLTIELPGGGPVEALRLQDLPAEHVMSFIASPPGVKELAGVRLFQLALGSNSADVIQGMTFGELEHVMGDWLTQSGESEERDEDGRGDGLDWTPPWV